jgi:hypothetical protein
MGLLLSSEQVAGLPKGADKKMEKRKHSGALAAAAGVLVAVGLLLLMIGVQAQPAEATFPGLPGKIAYTGADGTDTEIFTINPNGDGTVQVTNNDTPGSEPSYSPDGKKIAYVGFDGTNEEIYTINVGGGGKSKVTGGSNPAWGSRP